MTDRPEITRYEIDPIMGENIYTNAKTAELDIYPSKLGEWCTRWEVEQLIAYVDELELERNELEEMNHELMYLTGTGYNKHDYDDGV